jgi:hypothetical protein
MNVQVPLRALIVLAGVGFAEPSDTLAQVDNDDRVIPMRLEIILDSPECVAFENFTLKARMVNPNDYPVMLFGFKTEYIAPEIHVLGRDGEWHQVFYGTVHSSFDPPAVTIPAQGFLERHRFLFNGFSWERWPVDPGVFELRAKTHLSRAALAEDGPRYKIDWTYPPVQVRVGGQTVRDRMAMNFLRTRLMDHAEAARKGDAKPTGVFRIELHREFLDRYPDVVYAPEIRWELAKLLLNEVSSQWSPLHDDPEMVDLFEECLTFCLQKGGAYAEDFLKLGSYSRARSAMELATKHKKFDLVKRIVKELDKKYPEDEAAILNRRVHVLAETESVEKAWPVARTLAEKFPDSKYARSATRYLEYLERKRNNE